jgi:hypothetical protein
LGGDKVDHHADVRRAESAPDDPDDVGRLPAAHPGLADRRMARREERPPVNNADGGLTGQLPFDPGQALLEQLAVCTGNRGAGLVQQDLEPVLRTEIDVLDVRPTATWAPKCMCMLVE